MHKIINNTQRAPHLSPNKLQRIVKCCQKIKKHLNSIKRSDEDVFTKNAVECCEIWCNLIIMEIEGK